MPRAPNSPGDDSVEAYLESLNDLHQRLDEGMSFSGHERNKVFLNCGVQGRAVPYGRDRFAEASAVSGLDFDDDARGLAFFDWDHDGDLDLALSNRTAPRIRLMLNSTPPTGGFVAFALEGDGVVTNRDAIGARVVVETSEGRILRTLRAGEGFLSQSSRWLHFGLGRAELTGRTVVRWPGGDEEVFAGAQRGRRYRLVQGEGHARVVEAPARRVSLPATPQQVVRSSTGERVVVAGRPPAPSLTLRPFGEERPRSTEAVPNEVSSEAVSIEAVPIETGDGTAVLLNLWASWCLPCRKELQELGTHADSIRAAGLEIVALSTDGMGDDPLTRPADAQRFMDEIAFPFLNGLATPETLDKVDIIKRYLFDRQFPLSLPFSLLIDRQGRVAALYRGGIDPEELVRDLAALDAPPGELREMSVPFEGRWFTQPRERASVVTYAHWFEDRFPDESVSLLHRAVESASSELSNSAEDSFERRRARDQLGEAFRRLAFVEGKRNNHAAAARHNRSLLELEPGDAGARSGLLSALFEGGDYHQLEVEIGGLLDSPLAGRDLAEIDLRVRLAEVLEQEERHEAATRELNLAVALDPDDARLRYLLAHTLARQRRIPEAMEQFEKTVELDPDHEEAHAFIGLGSLSEGDFDKAVRHFLRVIELNPRNLEGRHGLARAYAEAGRAGEAVPHYEALIEMAPQNAIAHHELGLALVRLGDSAEGVEHVRRAYALDQRLLPAANNVAWILATHPEEELRNGAEAVRLAQEINASTGHREPAFLETLAAALAETGDYEAAAQTVERAIEIARETGQQEQLLLLQSRLDLYRSGKTAPRPRP